MFFDTITKSHQIKNIEDYLDGITLIPTKPPKPAEREEHKDEPAKPASGEKTEVQVKTVEEPAGKPAEKAAENPEAARSADKAPEKPVAKPQEKVAENPVHMPAPTPVQSQKPTPTPAQAQKPVGTQQKPFEQRQSGNVQMQRQDNRGQSSPNQGRQTPPPQQGGYAQQQRQFGNAASQGQRPAFNQQNFQRPAGGQQDRSAQKAQPGRDKAASQGGGNFFRDKDGGKNQLGGLKETFKPQPIIRTQTSGEGAKQRGAVRVVDIRGTDVNLSKYDEKLETFIPDTLDEIKGGSQKVKKPIAGSNRIQPSAAKAKGKNKVKKAPQPVTKAPTHVTLPDEIKVSDLASALKVTSAEVVKKLMGLGMMVTVNQTVDYDTAAIVADEFGIAADREVVVTIEEKLFNEETENPDELVTRSPVVCVMGHVDHGKTSILDAIRHTSVTQGEAGGITQHIGAYRVKAKGQYITFLDTPGHEAFTAMRARGAKSTDIAILVVAADDGVMPQTIEAINHAKSAGVDIIVAINKMDKPTANPEAIKQELTKYDLVPEEWGGDTICVPVSALTKQGIDDLLDTVLLVAEMKDLKANPNRRAKGIVIEAKLDKGKGPVATVLVQNGTLRDGDIVIAGTAVGRVRAMSDHNGRAVKEAEPSVPVEIIGLSDVPLSGDEFNAVEDERMARTLADQRKSEAKEEEFKVNARASLGDLFAQMAEGVKELNIVVKADVGGSAEAVKQALEKISNDEVKVRVIHAAVGGIREGDVTFAAASNAIIVGFNVRPDKVALDSAERQNVEIRTYRIIYDCINEITDAMKGMLAPKFRENLLGHAEVRQTINVPGVGTIAGSYVQDGKVMRSAMIRVVRDGVVIFEDKISSLRRFKDDVKEVAQGYECGIGLEKFNDIKIGDILEAYIMEEIAR